MNLEAGLCLANESLGVRRETGKSLEGGVSGRERWEIGAPLELMRCGV